MIKPKLLPKLAKLVSEPDIKALLEGKVLVLPFS